MPPAYTSSIVLDHLAIARIREHHQFTAPCAHNLSEKLLLVIEELVEAHRHLREGHDLRAITTSLVTGFWCQQHHKTDCQECPHPTLNAPHGDAHWERYNLEQPEGFPIEMADAFMRLTDIVCSIDIPINHAIQCKMDFNRQRPTGHGRRF